MNGEVNLTCFICNSFVFIADYYNVSNYNLKISKKKLVAVLGKLLGDSFLIVCNEDDVICTTCVKLFDKFDNLEVDMISMKRSIISLLEKKLRLDEGTIEKKNNIDRQPRKPLASFAEVKLSAEQEMEALEDLEDARSKIMLQCDNCTYTTNYMSFVRRHVKNSTCSICKAFTSDGKCTKKCEASLKVAREAAAIEQMNSQTITLFNDDTSEQTFVIESDSEFQINGEDESALEGSDLPFDSNEKKTVYFQLVDGTRQVVAVTDGPSSEAFKVLMEDDMTEVPESDYM